MSKDSRSFGRTGPAEVRTCGCNVLPWEPCEHSEQWDDGKSLDRVIQEARDYFLTPPPSAPQATPAPTAMPALMLLARCRRIVARDIGRGGKRAKEAQALIAEIDALGSLPA